MEIVWTESGMLNVPEIILDKAGKTVRLLWWPIVADSTSPRLLPYDRSSRRTTAGW